MVSGGVEVRRFRDPVSRVDFQFPVAWSRSHGPGRMIRGPRDLILRIKGLILGLAQVQVWHLFDLCLVFLDSRDVEVVPVP